MEEVASSTESSDYLDELLKPEDHYGVETILEDDNAASVILLKTFEYLSVLDLLNASQVSKLWNFVGSHDLLWRNIRLKNCYLNDYNGLFKKLLKHGTQELDIEDAILVIPDGMAPNDFWRKMFKRIKKITTLKKVNLGICPINSVFKISMAAPQLKSFSASHLFRGNVNLAPLTLMDNLEELTLKGTHSIILTSINSMQNLKGLRSLSMKRIINLHELVSFLPIGLRSLELGWLYKNYITITNKEIHGVNMGHLSRLVNLRNLCLSDETELGIYLNNSEFLKPLNKLEYINFDRVYSDDLLKYLPPSLRSLTFDWNTFKLDLSFLSKLILLSMLTITDYNKQLFLLNVCSLYSLKHLTSLTLKGVNNLKDVENWLPPSLESLQLGDCYSLSSDFTTKTIPELINLKRLELENGLGIFETTDLLNVIAKKPGVIHLSLINMEFKRGFHESLSQCTYLESLCISPYFSRNLDLLSIHQRIIYSVASLKDTLKSFNLGFDYSFLDVAKFINGNMVKVLPWNGTIREEEVSIIFVNPCCPCAQPCVYPLHVIMVPVEVIEKEILPQLLPKTFSWITKSGLVRIYPDGKLGRVRVGEPLGIFSLITVEFSNKYYPFGKYC